eukprot:TRINITY_DN11608_c1_g1_i1.p1 TRINITY_DN11608_c1_g1~~TRINITY_DN11608_c1_g1_i1.p1  ORF type:complete len:223 (+),score=8.13 TRINITY_DN11608_c1_g1_i1:141-809(+)
MTTQVAVGRALNKALGAENFVSLCTWLTKETQCTDEEIITAFIILDRYIANNGTVSSGPWGKERILAMSVLLSMKVCRDKAPLNSMIAKLVSLSLKQFNAFESQYLVTLGFSLFVSRSDYIEYSEILMSSSKSDTTQQQDCRESEAVVVSRKRPTMSPSAVAIVVPETKRHMHRTCFDLRTLDVDFEKHNTNIKLALARERDQFSSSAPSSSTSTPRSTAIS